jgi:hypothetical protein
MYHAMSSEQEAKSALNRPVPVPTGPMADNAKKILGPTGSGSAGGAPTDATASGSRPPVAPIPAGQSGGAASAGGATGGAGAGAAGPIGAAVIGGAAVARAAATAGPKAGGALGRSAEGHTQSAGDVATAPTPGQQTSVPPSRRSEAAAGGARSPEPPTPTYLPAAVLSGKGRSAPPHLASAPQPKRQKEPQS